MVDPAGRHHGAVSGVRKYKPGPDVEAEVVRDSKGNVIDEAYIERAVEDVHRHVNRGDSNPPPTDEVSAPQE